MTPVNANLTYVELTWHPKARWSIPRTMFSSFAGMDVVAVMSSRQQIRASHASPPITRYPTVTNVLTGRD